MSDDDGVDSLYNYPVQGTRADGFKMALIDMDRELSGQNAQIVHILNDGIIVEARENNEKGGVGIATAFVSLMYL